MSKNYLLMPGGFQSMLRLRAYLSLVAKQMYQYTSRPIKRTKYNLAIDNVSSLGEEGVKMWMVQGRPFSVNCRAEYSFVNHTLWHSLKAFFCCRQSTDDWHDIIKHTIEGEVMWRAQKICLVIVTLTTAKIYE